MSLFFVINFRGNTIIYFVNCRYLLLMKGLTVLKALDFWHLPESVQYIVKILHTGNFEMRALLANIDDPGETAA